MTMFTTRSRGVAHSPSKFGGKQRPTGIARLALVLLIVAVAEALSPAAAADVKPIGAGFEISGRVPDVRQVTHSSGHRFQLALSGLHYRGRVERTLLELSEESRVTIWIALKNVSLTIDRITLSGRPGSAVCGPTSIEMGNRRELWLAFDFAMADDVEKTLTLLSTRFGLPPDNWSVGTPAWVTTSGIGMSHRRVAGGIRSGLTNSRDRIEHEFTQIAPDVLAEFASVPGDSAAAEAIEDAIREKLAADGHLPDPP